MLSLKRNFISYKIEKKLFELIKFIYVFAPI